MDLLQQLVKRKGTTHLCVLPDIGLLEAQLYNISMEPIDLTHYLELVGTLIIEYGARLAGAVLALIIGMWLINKVVFRLSEAMRLKNIEPSLIPFLRSVLNIGLKVALVISIAGMVGIEMTSFVAILGAAGLAVGLAMQGTLQNFAGGVMILLFKPYKVGD